MKKNLGFTLIEILIVMVVIGILAAIAIPSYQNQLRKGTRAAAQAVMMDIANKEIFYLQAQRVYTKTWEADLGMKVPDDVDRFYTITVDFPDPQTTPPSFTITATPKAGRQEGDGNLTLDNVGAKTPADKW